ncbi:E3 ubiquitin-protein ligase TRIM58-like [Paramormyrops kingsleyae]|uniref:E3 ubiquitin-protein ligase TRIM58-like n=1 Tax=Paramormyrops kingsleyae TaxID=1676925 RepID=A0A3B3QP74_9TELE|nr:E3 ubiquitin-protein ligase TRIM58-like [Paramormyrops kingsleyae]XP_023692731.1 E3 ubiquitin-protein ligase TRIM58-like [Paramormyrops kingsleyae]
MMQCLHFLVEPAKTFAFHVKESRNKAKDERAEPLVESQVFIMELAKDLHRVCQRSDVLEHIWTCEDVWPATVCQAFIIDCAALLDGKVAGRLEGGDQSGPRLDSQETGGGHEEDPAKLAILEWTRKLKKLPEDSLWPGQAVVEILDDIAINWQKGCVPSLQPAVELLLWATLTEGLDKEAIPQKWLVWKQRIKNIDAIPYIPQKVWNWIREAAVEVTLDAETANPDLVLSPDERKMRCGFERQDLVNHPHRFDGWWCALGMEGFSAGRRYWEVEVGDRDWRLGVAKASAFRKGFKSLNTASGYLTLRLERGSEMKALTVPFTALAPTLGNPQRVGVYLDYEKGQLSFYDAKNRSHIYTYNETFSEELYPLFGTVEIINDMVIWSPGAPEPRCPGICVWG